MKNNTHNISKYLSYILRHKPESIGLVLDDRGWANIKELISKTTEYTLTHEMIMQIVLESEKQRFSIKDDKIRANQGHSINVDLVLEELKPPQILYHGTADRFLTSIKQQGLLPQERQHVHLSSNIETAIEVGKRHGKVIILQIDALKMHQHGYAFYHSKNKVWLTDNIPVIYISVVKG